MDADVLVIGGGLAGLVATTELAAAGRSVIVLDGEPLQALGGQAHWSLGGLFGVGTTEQRRMRIRDSVELAWADWEGSAAFDRGEDHWPLTRETLGGLEIDLEGRLRADGSPLSGIYAVGEAAGFGGGGMHGHRALEGTLLGGCLFTGRTAGRALAAAL